MLGLRKKYLKKTSTKIEKVMKRRMNPAKETHMKLNFLIFPLREETLLPDISNFPWYTAK